MDHVIGVASDESTARGVPKGTKIQKFAEKLFLVS
jgi:hypothetical protein